MAPAAAAIPDSKTLSGVVSGLLTPAVTAPLPPPWRGAYDVNRAQAWLKDREEEGSVVLLAQLKHAPEAVAAEPVALVVSYLDVSKEMRLGYMLAEPAWGKGLATELVQGFVAGCRASDDVAKIKAGVAKDNPASARVLEKAGFLRDAADGGADGDEWMYEVDVTE